MELSDLLAEESVFVLTSVKSKEELLEMIAERAGRLLQVDPEAVLDALANREALGSTGLGDGIAIPHGKLAGMTKVVGVFVKLEPAIDFDSVDDQPVDLVLALLGPLGAGAEHLKALSRVARALRSEELVSALRASSEPAQLYGQLARAQAAHKAA